MTQRLSTALAAGACLFFVCFSQAYAAAPVVTSFTAAPSVVSFGLTTTLNWSLANSSGVSLYITCPLGVSLTKDGGYFPCNSDQPISSAASDSAAFKILNVSGALQNVSARLTPKDVDGFLVPEAAASVSIQVATIPQPILDFSTSPQSFISGSTATLTWASNGLANVNLQFTCVAGVQLYSSDNQLLPCGSPAYSTPQSGSGSVSVKAVSSNSYTVDVPVAVLPAIGEGTYDATHALTRSLVVLPQGAAPIPSVATFASSKATLVSGETTSLSWAVVNASSTNILFQCEPSVSFAAEPTTTPTNGCGVPAFVTPLTESGTTSVTFTSKSSSMQYIWATLLMRNTDGSYDSSRSKSLMLSLYPPGTSLQAAPQVTTIGAAVIVTSSTTFTHAGQLTVGMEKGSKHPQVKILQALLAQDPVIYPDGSVTGFFGVLTDAAVKKFQEKYGLAKLGDSGYGYVGPKTRAKLNSL